MIRSPLKNIYSFNEESKMMSQSQSQQRRPVLSEGNVVSTRAAADDAKLGSNTQREFSNSLDEKDHEIATSQNPLAHPNDVLPTSSSSTPARFSALNVVTPDTVSLQNQSATGATSPKYLGDIDETGSLVKFDPQSPQLVAISDTLPVASITYAEIPRKENASNGLALPFSMGEMIAEDPVINKEQEFPPVETSIEAPNTLTSFSALVTPDNRKIPRYLQPTTTSNQKIVSDESKGSLSFQNVGRALFETPQKPSTIATPDFKQPTTTSTSEEIEISFTDHDLDFSKLSISHKANEDIAGMRFTPENIPHYMQETTTSIHKKNPEILKGSSTPKDDHFIASAKPELNQSSTLAETKTSHTVPASEVAHYMQPTTASVQKLNSNGEVFLTPFPWNSKSDDQIIASNLQGEPVAMTIFSQPTNLETTHSVIDKAMLSATQKNPPIKPSIFQLLSGAARTKSSPGRGYVKLACYKARIKSRDGKKKKKISSTQISIVQPSISYMKPTLSFDSTSETSPAPQRQPKSTRLFKKLSYKARVKARDDTSKEVNHKVAPITIPSPPKFHESHVKPRVKSTEEIDLEVIEEYTKNHPFRANPILIHDLEQYFKHNMPKIDTPKLTVPEPFHFLSDDRAVYREKQCQEKLEKMKECSISVDIVEEKPRTKKEIEDLEECQKQFRALPLPDFTVSSENGKKRSRQSKLTQPIPFKFQLDERLEKRHAFEAQLKEKEKQREREGLKVCSSPSIMTSDFTTSDKPFHIRILEKHEMQQLELQHKRKKVQEESNNQYKVFRALELPKSNDLHYKSKALPDPVPRHTKPSFVLPEPTAVTPHQQQQKRLQQLHAQRNIRSTAKQRKAQKFVELVKSRTDNKDKFERSHYSKAGVGSSSINNAQNDESTIVFESIDDELGVLLSNPSDNDEWYESLMNGDSKEEKSPKTAENDNLNLTFMSALSLSDGPPNNTATTANEPGTSSDGVNVFRFGQQENTEARAGEDGITEQPALGNSVVSEQSYGVPSTLLDFLSAATRKND